MARSPEFAKALQKLVMMQLLNSGKDMREVAQALGEHEGREITVDELKKLIREQFKAASQKACSAFESALLVERVAKRASQLHLGPGQFEVKNSAVLKGMKKFRKRLDGSLNTAVEVAAGLAKQYGKDTYCWQGNSYMHAVWHVTEREARALGPIENVGQFVYRVTPELDLYKHEVLGRPNFGVSEE